MVREQVERALHGLFQVRVDRQKEGFQWILR